MFEVIGIIVVTCVLGYLAFACLALNFVPVEFPAWQRILMLVLATGFVLLWWFLIGTDLTIGMK